MLTENDLHEYQRAGIKHILENPFCGLFLDMGLGKTVTTLTAINHLIWSLEISRVLVIAPKRVAVSVWPEELGRWEHLQGLKVSTITGTESQRLAALATPAEVYTLGRENVAWLCKTHPSFNFDAVIIDESSSFKNARAKRFKELKKVLPNVSRVILLTGTPAPNSLLDLWPQVYLLDRGQRLGQTLTAYREKYFTPDKRNGHIVYSYKIRKGAEAAIYRKIADVCLSMKALDFLEMPDKIENVINVNFSDVLRQKYKEFEKELVLELVGQDITAVNAAALSNKLLQFANGAIYDENKDVHEIHDEKLDALEEIVSTATGPVLVAWTFRHDRDRILKRLSKYGAVQLDLHRHIEQWNAGEIPVMLMHPASGGHGLNLQRGGNLIVWFGLTWSLELYQQFVGRLYRQGQKSDQVIINIIKAAGTLDEQVIRALKGKETGQNRLLDAVKAKIKYYEDNRQ